jgi:hypothetical protein
LYLFVEQSDRVQILGLRNKVLYKMGQGCCTSQISK